MNLYKPLMLGSAHLQHIDSNEKKWIDGLNTAFSSHHIADEGPYEVFMMSNISHTEFNFFGHLKFYIQHTHVGERETPHNTRCGKTYYIHYPMFKPTGTFSVDHGSQTMTCLDGVLHDASGMPAMISSLFGNAYYLHGESYEPNEYFTIMERQRKDWPESFSHRYPEYDPKRYVEYMASVLGSKT